ncbi:Pde12 [Symbiodinium sp. CCMP2592]|nr:Pde12 [Symbiodinium sp. CCMP2592]
MEATVRLLDNEPNVSVQVLWRGAELNLLRSREEPVERFLQRLALSCSKQANRLLGGPDKKKAKKESNQKQKKTQQAASAPEAAGTSGAQPASSVSVALYEANEEKVAVGTPVAEALRRASHVVIEGERVPISVNPPSVQKLEVFGRALAGCPLSAILRCEFCDASTFTLRWLTQVAAGASGLVQVGHGNVFWVPEAAKGRTLHVEAEPHPSVPSTSRSKGSVRVGVVEEVPRGWPEQRVQAFGKRAANPSTIRVVSFNILAVPYARTQLATQIMYPYCPSQILDYAYRQPLLGREIQRLDGDIVFLQECTYFTYLKFFQPLFGERYHLRCSLKASHVSEGCLVMVRTESFEVLQEKDCLFRNLLRTSQAFRPQLQEVAAKWPDFLTGILPRMSTVFQLTVVRHRASGRILVLANTHLFYHPNARHIRLLQIMCLLHEVQELRNQHKDAKGELPHIIFAGDLNCLPETGAVQLLLTGQVPSDHEDWETSSQFAWRDEEASADTGEAEEIPKSSVPSMEADETDVVEPLPREAWQKGSGIALQNPLGALVDVYANTPQKFTNYVHDFSGILDYILTDGQLQATKCLLAPAEKDVEVHGGLPSVLHPSDHLSIAADLTFRTSS